MNSNKTQEYLIFVVSVLIHLVAFLTLKWIPNLPNSNKDLVEIEIQDIKQPSIENKGPVIIQPEIPKELLTDEKNNLPRFESENDQSVKKQTKAKNLGATKNAFKQQDTAKEKQSNNQQNDISKYLPEKSASYFFEKKATAQNSISNVNQESTIGQVLPDEIQIGEFTALNTDRNVFYSFYKRIDDMIRFPWENAVKNSIQNTSPNKFRENSRGQWNTQLEVVVKPNGEIKSVNLLKSSGFKDFDEAAIQAFRQARLFPNPPQGMIKEDGLIRLSYSFVIRI
jgi:TonB family protein